MYDYGQRELFLNCCEQLNKRFFILERIIEVRVKRTEIDLGECEIDLNECEIDLNECEHFLKAN